MAHSETKDFNLPDGAKLAYETIGSGKSWNHLPIVLVGGVSNLKNDWERLALPLSQKRPVLVYDHRGIGESTYSTPGKDEDISIESMARDLLALIQHVGWKNVDVLGFSMGGVILQQLLLLLHHPAQANPPPFRVHHAFLTGTMCSFDPLRIVFPPPPPFVPPPPGQLMTAEQKKELTRPMLDASLGPKWVALPENKARYEWWLEGSINGRPMRTILKQRKALSMIHFREQLSNIPSSVKVLVIHGREDLVVPFSSGEEILQFLPHAQIVKIGSRRGQVPSYDFGHIWFEYFAVDVWVGVVEAFVDDEGSTPANARL
ncbi:alpha/beta-hydrolase [Ramaria rubella]|nr:alpha/beta-hydrolase [Ramaria rubella]